MEKQEMTIEELNNEHIRLIDWADEAETDRQAKNRLKKVSEFETYYKARFKELRETQATDEITVQETMEAVEGISKTETVEQTEEQPITNTETVKSENVPHKTKTILVGKDAYFYLKNEQKKQEQA